MKKTNNISKIVLGLAVAGVIGGVVYFNQKDNTNSQPVIAKPVAVVEKAPIQAVLNMEIEKPFNLQIF